MKLPISFDEIVAEIIQFTDLPEAEIKYRVWMQSLEPGWNVIQDVARFGVTPFQYNQKMMQLYCDGDGFIFDSMVFWANPARYRWIQYAADRIRLYATRHGLSPAEITVLALGDGAGNDSLFLADQGFCIDYFDVPGGKTFDFATKRFEHYGFLGHQIKVVPDYQICLARRYDVVLSFEVLEHLPEPCQAIKDIGAILKNEGLALITEDFGDIAAYLPTHLKATANYMGKTPFLFLQNGLILTWYSRDQLFKPYEFVKRDDHSIKDFWSLLMDGNVRGQYLSRYTKRLNRFLGKLIYLGSS